jgi:ADP-ribose pyrophosphatase YjhB (NUDIX family)
MNRMNEKPPERKTIFATPWFQLLESPSGGKYPNYSIQAPDFVTILAVTEKKEILLVRQFRHAVQRMTLELPAGHIELGETPEQAARKELVEETGHVAENFELLACLPYSPARFTNRLWCYFAGDARRAPDVELETGMNCVVFPGGLNALLAEPDFGSAGNWAVLMAAVAKGKLKI